MTPRYHLERDSIALYIWRTGGPCLCIITRALALPGEAEKLAAMWLAAANGEEGKT